MADLDSILSGQGAAASETPETVTTEAATTTATEATQENQQQTGAEGEQGQRMVPHEALHAEKQKVKRYTEEVADLRTTISQQGEAFNRQFSQLMEAMKPKPTEAEKPKKDIWDDPDEFVQSGVQAVLTPFQTEMQKTLLGIAKDAAVGRYDEATVDAAEQAFMQAIRAGTVDQSDYEKVRTAPNRYSAAVAWHKRSQAQAEIGDPVAFKEKLRAEILAELQAGNGQQQQQAQPGTAAATVMPTDLAGTRNVGARSGPAWSGPASLNDIFDRARKPKVA